MGEPLLSRVLDNYSSYATNFDSTKGIFLKVEFKRHDGTDYMVSQLSNQDARGNYQTDTQTFYKHDGTTVQKVVTWTITYDANGRVTSRVPDSDAPSLKITSDVLFHHGIGAVPNSNPDYYVYTATGGETLITLPAGKSYVTGSNTLKVFLMGALQYPGTYTETSSTSVTMSQALLAGQQVLLTWDTIPPMIYPAATSTTLGSIKSGGSLSVDSGGIPTLVNVSGTITGSALWTGSQTRQLTGASGLFESIKATGSTGNWTIMSAGADNYQIRYNDDGSNNQIDATKPSWALTLGDMPGDGFGIYRKKAGGTAWPNLLYVSGKGFLTLNSVGSGSYGFEQNYNGFRLHGLPRPLNLAATANGTTGSSSHIYYVYAKDAAGRRSYSASVSISNANATISSTNSVTISWSAVPGAVSYDILKDSLTTSIAVGITGTSFTDTGAATSAYSNGFGSNETASMEIDGPFVMYSDTGGPASGASASNGTSAAVPYRISLTDGSGRVQEYWNVDGSGSIGHTYFKGNLGLNEPAFRFVKDPNGGLFNINWAPAGAPGTAITWKKAFAVDVADLTNGKFSVYTPINTFDDGNGNMTIGNPSGTGVNSPWFSLLGKNASGTTTQAIIMSDQNGSLLLNPSGGQFSSFAVQTKNTIIDDGNGNMTTWGSTNGGIIWNLKNTNSGSGAYSSLKISNDASDHAFNIFTNSSTRTADGGANSTVIRTDIGDLVLGSNGYERIRLSTDGSIYAQVQNLYITGGAIPEVVVRRSGTLSASAPEFHYEMGRWAADRGNIVSYDGTTVKNYLSFSHSDNSVKTNNTTLDNGVGNMVVGGTLTTPRTTVDDGGGNMIVGASVKVETTNGNYQFYAHKTGNGYNDTNIAHAAYVANLDNTNGTAGYAYSAYLNNLGTNTYYVRFDGYTFMSGGYTSSDSRLKTNVQPIASALESVQKIRGVYYNWDTSVDFNMGKPEDRQLGVIAQEVEEVFPELVTEHDETKYKAVDYSKLTAVLVEAVKELKGEVDSLRAELAALKGGSA